jgi:hypothetical protein
MIATLEEGNLTATVSMAILNKLKDQGRYTATKRGKALDLYSGDEGDGDGWDGE